MQFSWNATKCKNATTTNITTQYQNCVGNSSCTLTISEEFWDTAECPNILSQKYYFNAYCTGILQK